MALFGVNYNRPGPGIEKDAPKQKAVPRFFSILQRKFFDLCKLNLLFCVPVLAAGFLVYLLNRVTAFIPIDLLPMILLFPFIGGLTYVTRNYAREEHAFIYSDFMDAVKSNWKPLLLDGILCYIVTGILSVSIPYYWTHASQSFFNIAASGICSLVALLFLFSQYYVPVMIVTFDLKLKQILKNSLIFAILGVGRNLLITGLLGVLVYLMFLSFTMPLTIMIAALFCIFLAFAYSSFLINFAVYPLIDKAMIQPYNKKLEQEKGLDKPKKTKRDFTDKG